MNLINRINWIKIGLLNLLIVGVLGVLMRYKIGFEFPYFNQKNIQHAHSHFALCGWISLTLMFLMVDILKEKISRITMNRFNLIFTAYLVCSFGMLISFFVQGYGFYSILFSTLSVLVSFLFCWQYLLFTRNIEYFKAKKWFVTAILFNILSTLGTFYLSYMMASKNINQHTYLASVYWYLHFQYNGWFFFCIIGLFYSSVKQEYINLKYENIIFWLFALSCIPAYGLSVLWANIVLPIYIMTVLSAILQSLAWLIFLFNLKYKIWLSSFNIVNTIKKVLPVYIIMALTIKLVLQLGSVIPSVSNLAFGFRPIVIAYLHLVLLAFTSMFILTYLYLKYNIFKKRRTVIGLSLFAIGVFFNELFLAIQGIASFSYTLIPKINEALFSISLMILLGLILINYEK